MAALNEFLFHERSYKPVSNPANGTGGYTASDTVKRKTAGDSPLAQSLKRCHRRIDKDLSRGHITERDKDRLYKKSNEMFMELPEKDRNILGRAAGVFGYKRWSLQKIAAEEILPADST